MHSFGGVLCGICLNFYVDPLTVKCSHSFCDSCLRQYLLLFSSCPICDKQIKMSKPYPATSIKSFVENLISQQDESTRNQYYLRKKNANKRRSQQMINNIEAGMKVDIRDEDHKWREGIVIRVITRVGEKHKFLKIRYLKQNQQFDQKQDEVKVISQRIAPNGYFTGNKNM